MIAAPGQMPGFREEFDEDNNLDQFNKLSTLDADVAYIKVTRCKWKMTKHEYIKEYSSLPDDYKETILSQDDEEGYLIDSPKGYDWYKKEHLDRVIIGEHPFECSGMNYYLFEYRG